MKRFDHWIRISIFAAMLPTLSGCVQVNTARQWWQVWRNPISSNSPAKQSYSRVSINLQEIAKHHPAWKLAEQMESSPPAVLKLNWKSPKDITKTNSRLHKSTFTSTNASIISSGFSEAENLIEASNMETLNTQMSQEQRSSWEKWKTSIKNKLQEDLEQVGRAMRVDLNDRIAQTQKNIPEISVPIAPPAEIQNEMINLRLKLLNNITLSPEDKTAAQNRLDQLERQWANQLRQQAQQNADKQRYWRETVPRQLRQEGEANIQQTLQLLQLQDQKTIDLSVNNQQNWLEQDNAQNKQFSLKLPLISSQLSRTQSTFHTSVPLVKSIKPNHISIPAPSIEKMDPVVSLQSEVIQLKRVAMEAASDAAAQSAARHHWQWITEKSKGSAALPDATSVVLRESNFK